MSEFKVGDKVVCTDSCGSSGCLIKGETYTVAAYDSDEEGEWVAVLEDPSYVDDPAPVWIPQRFEPAPVAVSTELEAQIEQSAFGVGDRVVDEAGYAGTVQDISFGLVLVLFDSVTEEGTTSFWMPKTKLRSEKKIAAVAIPTEEVIAQDVGSAATSKHYNSMFVQPIEVWQMVLTHEEFIGALKSQVMKYSIRAGSKEGESSEKDNRKASQYKMWLDLAKQGKVIDPRTDVV